MGRRILLGEIELDLAQSIKQRQIESMEKKRAREMGARKQKRGKSERIDGNERNRKSWIGGETSQIKEAVTVNS